MNARAWGRRTRLGLMAGAFAMAFALAPSGDRTLHAVDAARPPGTTGLAADEVALTGCVIKGDNGGYVLTSVVPASIDVANRTARSGQTAGTSGTPDAAADAAGASRVIYWLEDFEDHAGEVPDYTGRRVEIRGELEGGPETGELEVERDGDWVTIKLEKDGEDDVVTRLPATVVMSAGSPVGTTGQLQDDEDVELNVNVRKLDVKEVRVVTGTCG